MASNMLSIRNNAIGKAQGLKKLIHQTCNEGSYLTEVYLWPMTGNEKEVQRMTMCRNSVQQICDRLYAIDIIMDTTIDDLINGRCDDDKTNNLLVGFENEVRELVDAQNTIKNNVAIKSQQIYTKIHSVMDAAAK